jgi:nucleotide-binding universal stress UspA family protein
MSLVHKILVPSDFSEGSDRALDYAIEIARDMSASLLLAHVYASPVVLTPEGVVTPLVDEVAVRADLDAGLTRLAARAREHSVGKVEVVQATGVPWREVVRAAKDHGCDLIVMGTHGRGGFSHLFLGSVAEKVVRKAHCPVLTVGPRVAEVPA